MKKNIIIGVLIALVVAGFIWFNSRDAPEQDLELGGRSGPVRDIVGTRGTPTATTTAGEWLFSGLDLGSVTTATDDGIALIPGTDSVSVTIETTAASSTKSFSWHILGSNDDYCDTTVTSTEDDSYVAAEPLVGDINWYDIDQTDANAGIVDVTANVTGTSFMLTDVNWGCLKTEYKGASTTILMQFKEKVLTIQ